MSEAATGEPIDLMKSLGLVERLEMNAEQGRAAIAFQAGMHMCHSGGVVQGGFIAGWIDSAMAHACMAMTGPGIVPMSLELKVSYFAPARPGRVVAEAWIERKGKTVCFAEGRLLDGAGKVLAKATSTIQLANMTRVTAAAQAAVAGG